MRSGLDMFIGFHGSFGAQDNLFKCLLWGGEGTEVKRENLLAHTTESPTVDLGLRVAKSKAEVLSSAK